jgi:predicted permease
MLADLRFALRALRRSPGFVVVAVLSVALGVGLNASVFSMVNGLVIRALPFPEPDRVLMLYAARPAHGVDERNLAAAEVADLRARSRSFAAVAGMYGRTVNLAGAGEAERLDAQAVTHDLLPLVGVRPLLGRTFRAEDDRPGAAPVVVLSHDVWQRRFGGRADAVGRAVLLDGKPHTVVGVMPPRFRFPLTAQLWLPAALDASESRDDRYVWTLARLRPGVALDAARAETEALGRRLAGEHGTPGWELHAKPLEDEFVEAPLRVMLGLMSGSVALVVLIVCANLGNLALARAAGRTRELALRSALGARRARLVRLLLAEGVLVSLPGGLLGAGVAWAWNRYTLGSIPEELPYWLRIEVDPLVVAFAVLLSLVTGMVFSAVPALRASRPRLSAALRDGGRAGASRDRARLRATLVGAQVALAVVLLVGTGLMVRSFVAMRTADLGVDQPRLLTLRTYLAGPEYATAAARAGQLEELARRVTAVPGVRAAAWTTTLPADDGGVSASLFPEGDVAGAGAELTITTVGATAGAYAAMGAAPVAGREFTAREAADTASRVALLNRALAERLWPGAAAVGRRVRVAIAGEDTVAYTVVGVVPDVVYQELGEASPSDRLQVHLPYGRMPYRRMTLLARAAGDPAPLAGAVRGAVRALDATLPTFEVRTMRDVVRETTWPSRLYGQAFAAFGLLALGLAALGVYGTTAYAVAQRRHEVGVRLALGARADQVVRAFVRDTARAALPGVALGVLGAAALSRLAAGVLYGVTAADPLTFFGAPLVLLAAALAAAVLPARRAARIAPVAALRAD